MSASQDWLCHNHEALFNQGSKTTSYLAREGNKERMGIIGANGIWYDETFLPKWNGYSSAYLNWADPAVRNQLSTAALNDAQKAFEPPYRQLYVGLLKVNPSVTDEDLIAMGMPARRSGAHVRAAIPASYPDYTLGTSIIRRISISFRDHESGSKAKPRGVAGAVIRWGVLEAPPIDGVESLQNSALDTASPYILTFSEQQRGKMVYVCLAWQNTKGEMGPWGKIENAIIP